MYALLLEMLYKCDKDSFELDCIQLSIPGPPCET